MPYQSKSCDISAGMYIITILGEEQKELNSENQDAAGEINNIIYGNAKSDFSSYGQK